MTTPTITVVIGTFNGAHYIAEQLESLLRQTVLPDEILVCDDGSTDGTLAVVERMAADSHVEVRVIRNPERLGFSDNFLNGATLARGRYIAFCDQDDVWRADKIETVLRLLKQHDARIAAHAVTLINPAGDVVGSDPQGIRRTRVAPALSENPWRNFFGFSLTVDRSLLELFPRSARGLDTHASNGPLSHDRWACFLGLSLSRSVFIAEPLAQYRQHAGQLYGSVRAVDRTSALDPRAGLTRFATSVERLARNAQRRAEICEARAELLADADWSDAIELRRATKRWAGLARTYSMRSTLYRGPRIMRLRTFLLLLFTGSYGSARRTGLGLRSILQDLSSLVVTIKS